MVSYVFFGSNRNLVLEKSCRDLDMVEIYI